MIFQIRNPSDNKLTYCGVLEFGGASGKCVVPAWVMRNIGLEEGKIREGIRRWRGRARERPREGEREREKEREGERERGKATPMERMREKEKDRG
jgi:hypothetical protein